MSLTLAPRIDAARATFASRAPATASDERAQTSAGTVAAWLRAKGGDSVSANDLYMLAISKSATTEDKQGAAFLLAHSNTLQAISASGGPASNGHMSLWSLDQAAMGNLALPPDPSGGSPAQGGCEGVGGAMDGRAASGVLAAYMRKNRIAAVDPDALAALETGSGDDPSSVQQAAKYMLANPEVYERIETSDVPGADGLSGVGNFERAAMGQVDLGDDADPGAAGVMLATTSPATSSVGGDGTDADAGFSAPGASVAAPSAWPAGNVTSMNASGSLAGANTVPDRIADPQAAKALVDQVHANGGGTLRIQLTHDELQDPANQAKVQAMLSEGDQKGVKIQVTLRDNDNGGGGNVLTGSALQQGANDIRSMVSQFGGHGSFVLDTFNEGGKSASQDWANMQTTLIGAARGAEYKGQIVVEDSNWGGGLTAGSESGLVKYASALQAANGSGNPALAGSIHEYSNDANATSRLTQEIDSLHGAGYGVQIGEVGNANWTGGNNFDERDNAENAVKANMSLLGQMKATVMPWMDRFVGGALKHLSADVEL